MTLISKTAVVGSALALMMAAGCSQPQPTISGGCNDKLIYDKPADIWEATLPLGNGRLGCMPDGQPLSERIVLNDISMWAGSEADYSNPQAADNLPNIRQLLFEGKNGEAQELMYKTFVPKATSGNEYGSYQMLGDLDIASQLPENQNVENYSRWLDMEQGVAYSTFDIGEARYVRECFASRNDDVIVVRYTCTGATMTLDARLSRPEKGAVSVRDGRLVLSGQLSNGVEDGGGVKYTAIMNCIAEGANASAMADTSGWHVTGASTVTFIVSAATSYLYPDNFEQFASQMLEKASATDYNTLKTNHIKAHNALYARVEIDLPGCGDSTLTTDKRIENFAKSNDPAMAVLYYNFGRYSLIGSTRPGSLPPNLQGLWANECGTPWNGDYHTNINVQMNHWPLEQGNLTELYEPLIALVERSVPSGTRTAKAFYGPDARGWVMHMMTNVWNFTAPGEHPSWGATNTGGAWLCAHLWEHFEYSLDTAYLRRIYPTMKGAADFFRSTMVVEPKHGWLVTAPTSSPENTFYIDGYDQPVSVCMGPTMDTQIIHELYGNVASAARILGIDGAYADSLEADIKRLPPMQISENGYLMEWLEDYREQDVHHRHVSHLYGLHPSNQITPQATPDLARACRATLDRRGDEGTGWSRAWKINFWARLGDGNRALKLFGSLLQPAIDKATGQHASGTFPNLWCSHPPFQLDGNYGGASGIAEMLLQSHTGYINALPALPDAWGAGSVRGMKVRGGAETALQWSDHKLLKMTLDGGKADSYKVIMPAAAKAASVHIYNVNNQTSTTPAEVKTDGGYTYFVVEPKCGNVVIEFEY